MTIRRRVGRLSGPTREFEREFFRRIGATPGSIYPALARTQRPGFWALIRPLLDDPGHCEHLHHDVAAFARDALREALDPDAP